MSIIYRIRGSTEFAEMLRGLPDVLRAAIEAKMTAQASELSAAIKSDLSGPVLQVKTGRLRASIYARVYASKSTIVLSVGSRGDVPYAQVQHDGGLVQHPGVSASKVSVFTDRLGAKKFTRGIAAHTIPIQGKNYIKGRIDSDRSGLVAGLRDSVQEAVRDRAR